MEWQWRLVSDQDGNGMTSSTRSHLYASKNAIGDDDFDPASGGQAFRWVLEQVTQQTGPSTT
jgi:hypothetical protein